MMKLAFITALLLVASSAQGFVRVPMNKKQAMFAPICIDKADAIRVADADKQSGPPGAQKAFAEGKSCGIAEVLIELQRIVHTVKTPDGRTTRVIEAQVDLEDGTRVTVFMLTDGYIEGAHEI
jgi:hypothetical protein